MKRTWLLRIPDDNGGGSPPTTEKPSTSTASEKTDSPSGNEASPEPSRFEKIALEVAAKHGLSQEPQAGAVPLGDKTAEDEAESSTDAEKEVTAETEEKGGEEKKPETQDDKTVDDKAEKGAEEKKEEDKNPPPFSNHPRWKEMVQQRDEARKDVDTWKAKASEYEPLAKAQQQTVDYLVQHGISAQEFQEGVRMMVALKTNPGEALKVLKPLMTRLQDFDEDNMPADLVAAMDRGEISEAYAKEIAKGRAGARNGALSSQNQEQQRQQREQGARISAVQTWMASKQRIDLDFKPKSGPNAKDGLFEFVADRFERLAHANPPSTPTDVTTLLETAYNEVKDIWTSRLTPTQPKKPKVTSASTTTALPDKKPRNMHDITAQVAAKHGITYNPDGGSGE